MRERRGVRAGHRRPSALLARLRLRPAGQPHDRAIHNTASVANDTPANATTQAQAYPGSNATVAAATPAAPSSLTTSGPGGSVTITPGLSRPYLRARTIRQVETNAARASDGRFLDANTLEPIDGPYHIGHTFGNEWWRIRDMFYANWWTHEFLNDYVNNADLYQIEDPANNVSHRFEMP